MSDGSQLQIYTLEDERLVRNQAILSDQWRLARVEIVNWGTFSGYQVLPVDRRGLLITGPSGSGKSSLLDAITTVLTPPLNRKLNAAALSGGSKGDDRTICSYIRGAWRHETDESGEVANTYLRPQMATWSGIMLRYESGHSHNGSGKDGAGQRFEPINLLVLFNLKAGSNTNEGLSTLYAVVRGEHTLEEFQPFVINGINVGSLNRAYKESAKTYREHSSFAAHFSRLMGIASSKTLVLLHKTQAAKNFGSLDDLFRKFMLDEPETFKHAETAIEQFSALDQAYAGVVDQRKQMHHLEPLIGLDSEYKKAKETIDRIEHFEQALGGFTGQLAIECIEAEKVAKQREADHLAEVANGATNELKRAQVVYDQAQTNMNDAGGLALKTTESDIYNAKLRLDFVLNNRKSLEKELTLTGISEMPESYAAWAELERSVAARANEAAKLQETSKLEHYASYGHVGELQKQQDKVQKELLHLRSQATNIPLKYHQVRVELAAHLGVSLGELPFVGELISIKPAHEQWRGAIERLLNQPAKTLLVAPNYVRAVATFLDRTHLGLRFEYEAVPVEVEVPARSLKAQSLVRKVEVLQNRHHAEFSAWVNKELRERFDFSCVELPAELAEHRNAITMSGQIKRGSRYIKDDRYSIDDQKRWILGSVNDDKIETLEAEHLRLAKAIQEATRAAQAIDRQTQITQNLIRLSETLQGASWQNYDVTTVQEDLLACEKQYKILKEGNIALNEAVNALEDARIHKEAAEEVLRETEINRGIAANKLRELEKEIGEYRNQWREDTILSHEEKKKLTAEFKKADPNFKHSTSAIFGASTRVQTALSEQKKAANDRMQKNQSASERLLHDFKLLWPLIAADLSEEFADVKAYIAIYQRIKTNGLPEYEQKFMQVLNDFSQDQITVLASTIRGAFKVVREKLIPVNKSLRLSEYAKGIHLQIETRDNRGKQVTEFLGELQAITQGSWNEDDLESAEARYKRTAGVIKRLASDEYADRKWRSECLDTRLHVGFIAKELDDEGNVQGVHSSDAGLSGGQKQKLVIFCLAAALRYQLADEDEPIPSYGSVILDEAFDKADHNFATLAMDIFDAFGFHMVLATPLKLLQTLERHIGAIASVHCEDSRRSSFQMVSLTEDTDVLQNDSEEIKKSATLQKTSDTVLVEEYGN